MTLTISDYVELPGTPTIEIARVISTANNEIYVSKKFHRIKSVIAQNHGGSFATGVKDTPKIRIIQGSDTSNAKLVIGHTAITEVFSLFIIGEF